MNKNITPQVFSLPARDTLIALSVNLNTRMEKVIYLPNTQRTDLLISIVLHNLIDKCIMKIQISHINYQTVIETVISSLDFLVN